jgi:PAS domain S-box-containing protein
VILKQVLSDSRNKIIKKWSRVLHTRSGERYGERPLHELADLTSQATDAYYAVLIHNDWTTIDLFLENIARIRLNSGFTLSEVQKAFNVYRSILVPILAENLQGRQLISVLNRLDHCLIQTIARFSDYFQALHEKQVREHAESLEKEVIRRTRELSESEAKYRALIEEINDGYFVNQNGRIVFANRAFCDMHGYSPEEVLDRPYLQFVAPDSVPMVKGFYEKRFRKENAPEQYIYYRVHKNGAFLPTENKVKVLLYQDEFAAAGICRDITERVLMEQRLRDSESLARIGQLTTSLAHEIRNPLSSVKISIQMLLETRKLDGEDERTMEISAMEIARLEKILTEMLDFAKPVTLELQPASLNDVILTCLELLHVRLAEKNIAVTKRLYRNLELFLMDSGKIEQALINILLNAIELLPFEGKLLIATRKEWNKAPRVIVEVTDNGPGVPTPDLPYIFDPFFTKKEKGTGLGLSNVKKIVAAHRGTVAALARPKGLCVRFTLPMRGINEQAKNSDNRR